MTRTKPTTLFLGLGTLLFVIVALGCVERVRELTAAEQAQVREYVSQNRPRRPQHRASVRFGDDIELIGYDVDAVAWVPGSKVRFTWYWHAKGEVGEGWKAFTHVCDGTGNLRFPVDDEGPTRRLYPVSRFREGDYVRDVQEITLPSGFEGPDAAVYIGIYRGDERMRITSGADDGDSRARVVTLPTGSPRIPNQPLDVIHLHAARAATPPTLDGRIDELGEWAGATVSSQFVDTMSGGAAQVGATVRAMWDDTNLYVAFDVADPFLVSPFRTLDDHLWEKDCVEIMLDPGGDGLNYFELQANPLGTVFDTRYDSRRVPQPIGHADWNSGMRVGVGLRGAPNDETDDEGYTVELVIPWNAFAAGTPAPPPPRAGESWRGNFYVMDTTRTGIRAAAWSAPRIPDFHFPPRFGEIHFDPGATP